MLRWPRLAFLETAPTWCSALVFWLVSTEHPCAVPKQGECRDEEPWSRAGSLQDSQEPVMEAFGRILRN